MANKKFIFNWQLYLGIVLVVTGGLFLADLFLPIRIMRFFWPLLIVLFGLTFIVGMLVAGRPGSGLAIFATEQACEGPCMAAAAFFTWRP